MGPPCPVDTLTRRHLLPKFFGPVKQSNMSEPVRTPLRVLARVFLTLGFLGFGGPFVIVGMLDEEVVKRRRLMSAERFGQGLSVAQMLPGPTGFQMAVFIGEELGGPLGGLVASASFLLPCVAIVSILSVFYKNGGQVPVVASMFAVMGPVALAAIASSAYSMGKKAVRTLSDIALMVASFVGIAVLNWPVPLVLIGLGLAGMLAKRTRALASLAPFFLFFPSATEQLGSLKDLIVLFFTTGSLAFGGGPVVIPLLQHDVVERFHWLSAQSFVDGVSIGQLTPGPIMVTATFIGYLAFGWLGAAIATLGCFTPGYVYMSIARRSLTRMQNAAGLQSFLSSVFPAAVGAIFASSAILAALQMHIWWQWLALAAALVAIFTFKQTLVKVFLAAAFVGVVCFLAGVRSV